MMGVPLDQTLTLEVDGEPGNAVAERLLPGLPLSAGTKARNLFWKNGSGFDAAALDYLIKARKEYYDRRQWERTLKNGDRVAVLGRGIAVVEKIDHNQVHVLLRNTYALRIPRNHVVWDQQNRRWECEAALWEEYSMRVALYGRVSTCNGQSPEMQLAELREYASRRG